MTTWQGLTVAIVVDIELAPLAEHYQERSAETVINHPRPISCRSTTA